jgi:uncharacterized membrane-anchored protein
MSRRTGPSDILRYSHLGIQFALVILAAIWAGRWLDRLVSTRGIFTLLGTFAGAGLGFYLLYRETQRLQSDRSAAPQDPDGAATMTLGLAATRPFRRPSSADAVL